MMEHIVKVLFKQLGLSFSKFELQLTDKEYAYLESEEDYMYDITSVANYIDTQISLRESQNS